MSSGVPTLGIIGAGQLAQMSLAPAAALGIELQILSSHSQESAAKFFPASIGDYRDLDQLISFASLCDVITFEHELVPNGHVRRLEELGHVVRPSSRALLHAQDKAHMRQSFQQAGLPQPEWKVITDAEEIASYPVILKSVSGGYDGRGVRLASDSDQAREALDQWSRALCEEVVAFSRELSIMIARSPHNQVSTWAVTETVQRDGICVQTISPAPNLEESLAFRAQEIALAIAEHIQLVGVMAVELFEVDGELLINEIALRPHNSGHWTIEGANTSQFEQHLRAVLDLPLGSTTLNARWAVMGNVLGTQKSDLYRPYLHVFARDPEIKVHNYAKEVRPGRKVGHVCAIGDDLDALRTRVSHAVDYISGVISE
ncbi:MAG: 5-(carboxyamino)imidazole ribonucleotide synthase [Actinobacteria bacterium]|nr:5-(carboxyamino)imidazole ribonucleotide synthase [Actinomycetota bacterium]